MQAAFAKILNMSLTGSIVIAVVLLTRLFLKRAPKIYSYALWAVVLFRLLCPLSITAGLSVLKPIPVDTTPGISAVSYQPAAQAVRESIPAPIRQQFVPAQPAEQLEQPETKLPPMQAAAYIWLAGASVMAVYSIAQYFALRRRLAEAVPVKENVYLADRISTPFVMGVIRPRVYLPSGTPREAETYILAHEEHHIRRGDPVWKLLGYAALCLHWFNPLVWLAFCLAGKDMEMSCDEAVIKRLGEHIRADYSQALLRLATHKRIVSGMPLAFGEGDTKGRVRNMAKWKKPKVWVSALCAALCLVILAACALNPKQKETETDGEMQIVGPARIVIRDFRFRTPAGCITEKREKKTHEQTDDGLDVSYWEFSDGESIIGGVNTYRIPENFSADNLDWLHELDLPEWQDDTLGYSAGGAPGDEVTVEFFSDVPEGQERTVLNEHNLYFYEGWIYDLWFDKLTVKPDVMEAILDTASLEEPKPNPTIPVAGMPFEIQEMPAGGYDYRTEADGSITFRKGDSIVGGIVAYLIPEGVYDPYDDIYLWLEDVGIPDYEDQSLAQMGGISGFDGCWSVTFASDVPEGVEPTVKRQHSFYVAGDIVYDFWLDEMQLDTQSVLALEDAVKFLTPRQEEPQTATQAQTELTFFVEGTEEKAMATLYAGDGYSLYILDEDWVYSSEDGQPVWESRLNPEVRLSVTNLSDTSLSAAQQWVRRRFEGFDLIEDNRGGLGGTNSEGIMADVRLISSGDGVYAVCCVYPLEAAEGFGARLAVMADTFSISTQKQEPSLSAEDTAFARCREVMDAVQSGSYHLYTACQYDNYPEKDYTEDYYYSGELGWLQIVRNADSKTDARMEANDRFFTNERNRSSEELIWTEKKPDYEGYGPWLGGFTFYKHFVTYVDTLTDEEGDCCMFRVDATYEDAENQAPCYYVDFYFDPQGYFVEARIQVNLFLDNAFTVTQSIVTLDADTVAEEIDREYQRAIG